MALGSNQRHARHGGPRRVLAAALTALGQAGLAVEAASPVMASAPLGPSRRRYANAAALVASALAPEELLTTLQGIEQAFGRRRRGARWRARPLDLDLVLWSGGAWASARLTVPHPQFRHRAFVLAPAAAIAPAWRDPLSGLTVRQLLARLTRPSPLP
ncbi:MAG: 2-amino-4-hydroxy-6-hydroxymethyldihydropteridine diphosphokinase [Cypionkella sp.]